MEEIGKSEDKEEIEKKEEKDQKEKEAKEESKALKMDDIMKMLFAVSDKLTIRMIK